MDHEVEDRMGRILHQLMISQAAAIFSLPRQFFPLSLSLSLAATLCLALSSFYAGTRRRGRERWPQAIHDTHKENLP